ncbi:hypothetical protein [Rhodopseudomonas palustris]|uniref:Uncharacterized protein n=1 Tax=Rhodopseudomonas palustris (strain BisB18) TaxID=316056 RepID=Q214N8_RHOPB
MADLLSILAANYTAVGLNPGTSTPYKNVDAKAYEGTWQGTYSNTKKFKITVTDVSGFRAQVKYEGEGSLKFQSVLIKDNAFRVGDSKFTLTGNGKATVKTAVTDPVTSQTSLVTGAAKRDT